MKKHILWIAILWSHLLFAQDRGDEMTGLALPLPMDLGVPGRLEQAVGFYANGSLNSATELAGSGKGYRRLFVFRDRGWGTRDLAQILQMAAKRISKEFPKGERLQVGDLSGPKGGAISGHGSHQNGLDADLAYYRTDGWEYPGDTTLSFPDDFVKDGKVTSVFDSRRNWRFLEILHETGRLNRVFVDAAIKKHFCRRAPKSRNREEILRRVRIWPNHADHIHVRLTCPTTSPRCVPQEDPPEGTGCEELAFREVL